MIFIIEYSGYCLVRDWWEKHTGKERMTLLCHFSECSGELLTKKTILWQENPCKHKRSKTQNYLGRNKVKGREAVLDKQAQINSQKDDGAVFLSLLWILSRVRNGYESAAGANTMGWATLLR